MAAERDSEPHIALLMAIQHGAEIRLEKHLNPEAEPMSVRILREHESFANLASTWMSATNLLHGLHHAAAKRAAAEREAAGGGGAPPQIVVPRGRY